jgi:uroporphyrinogen-III decarboxylase
MPIPKCSDFILQDITKWRDVIKFPDFSGVDWETMAKKDKSKVDPSKPYGAGCAAQGFFQSVMAFMGFSEGLLAIAEEPEEVSELINYLCDCYLGLADNLLKYYEPDFIHFADDIATEINPFISIKSFREIFAPVWRRYISFFKDRGYIAQMHNCGRIEDFLDDIVDMGFNAWDPAQVINDLVGIKAKFGNKLVICGGFNPRDYLPHIDISEDQCRANVRKTLDELAVGGGYIFAGVGGPASPDDELTLQRAGWINDEFEKVRYDFYKPTP